MLLVGALLWSGYPHGDGDTAARIDEAKRRGQRVEIAGYGGERKTVCLLSGVCLWYLSGLPPVPIRWVLVVDPTGHCRPEAFFSTDRTMKPQAIVEAFVRR